MQFLHEIGGPKSTYSQSTYTLQTYISVKVFMIGYKMYLLLT